MNNLKNILSAEAIAQRQALTVDLVQSETHRNDHSAALIWVARFVCKTTTDGERWMQADGIIDELQELRRLQRSFGYMTDDLLARRQRVTNNLRALVTEEGGVELWDTFNREL